MYSILLRCTLGIVAAQWAFCGASTAEATLLGDISFPNSGAESAQKDFIDGVLFLHNFEYDEAAAAFKRAQAIDSNFALAYWGEAMTYNHPLWNQQARDTAKEGLRRLGRTPKERAEKAGTHREKDYLHAVELLYGTVPETERMPKGERDRVYRDWMGQMHERYPADEEAATFYALSILGATGLERNVADYMKSAAIAMKVWDSNPEHPGAAHYLIHAFDDPDHAPLGLPMARAYSKIAPSAAHAQHMTSHIFVSLGMWDDTVNANEIALEKELANAGDSGYSFTSGHYAYWLLYGYLQQGRYSKAREIMDVVTGRAAQNPTVIERSYFANMRARYVIDTADWAGASAYAFAVDSDTNHPVYFFTSALSALRLGDLESARAHANRMHPLNDPNDRGAGEEAVSAMRKELEGLLALADGETERGVALLREAANIESSMTFAFGPPTIVLPSSELLGEVLQGLGLYDEAVKAYENQLERTPLRAQSLMGLAKAQGSAGMAEASARTFEQLQRIWHAADVDADGNGTVVQEISDTLD